MLSFYALSQLLNEATSADVARVKVPIDENDWRFLDHAIQYGITPGTALRVRYTWLLQNQDEVRRTGVVQFPRGPSWVSVPYDDPGIEPLVHKLQSLGLPAAARNGFTDFSPQQVWYILRKPKSQQGFWANDKGQRGRLPGLKADDVDETGFTRADLRSSNPRMRAFSSNYGRNFRDQRTLEDFASQMVPDGRGGSVPLLDPQALAFYRANQRTIDRTITGAIQAVLRRCRPDVLDSPDEFSEIFKQVSARIVLLGSETQYDRPGQMLLRSPGWINRMARLWAITVLRWWYGIDYQRHCGRAVSLQAGM